MWMVVVQNFGGDMSLHLQSRNHAVVVYDFLCTTFLFQGWALYLRTGYGWFSSTSCLGCSNRALFCWKFIVPICFSLYGLYSLLSTDGNAFSLYFRQRNVRCAISWLVSNKILWLQHWGSGIGYKGRAHCFGEHFRRPLGSCVQATIAWGKSLNGSGGVDMLLERLLAFYMRWCVATMCCATWQLGAMVSRMHATIFNKSE